MFASPLSVSVALELCRKTPLCGGDLRDTSVRPSGTLRLVWDVWARLSLAGSFMLQKVAKYGSWKRLVIIPTDSSSHWAQPVKVRPSWVPACFMTQ